MTLTHTYEGAPLGYLIPPTKVSMPSRAELGNTSMGGISPEDPTAALALVGHRPYVITETACSQPRLFTGWTVERGSGRSFEQGQFVGPDALIHDTTIVDLNAALNFRIITGTDGKRPEESVDTRLAWLLASNYVAGPDGTLFENTGKVQTGFSLLMDETDYREGYAADVLADLSTRYATLINFFLFWDAAPSTGVPRPGLFFDYIGVATLQCTLTISNDLADQTSTCFAPITESRLERTPEAVFSDVIVNYAGGKSVYRTMAATATAFVKRGTSISRPHIGKKATAEAAGDAWLSQHNVETDRITTSIQVPASQVGLIQAGMRMTVKFTHLADYTANTSMRIVACDPKATDDLARFYDVDLELVAPAVVTLVGGDEFAALLNSQNSLASPATYDREGDNPVAGWFPEPQVGTFLVPVPLSSRWQFIAVGASMAVRCEAAWICNAGVFGPGVQFATLTLTLTRGGTTHVLGSDTSSITMPPGLNYWRPGLLSIDVSNVHVELGDLIGVNLTSSYGADGDNLAANLTYLRVGRGTIVMNSGTVTWIGPGTGPAIILVPGAGVVTTGGVVPTISQTQATTAPTVTDDLAAGYLVGSTWINTATGTEYILVDNTAGAAVWTITTATGAPTTADYLVGTAQAGLSAEIVVGTTPGGELGGTWASPTVDATHSGSAHHSAVTLAASADVLLGLTGQALALDTQTSNYVFSGPTTGAAAAPTFRALVAADIAGLTGSSGELLVADGQIGPGGISASSYVEMTTTRTTTSATLEDITGVTTTITLQRAAEVAVWLNAQTDSDGICDLGLAINIDGADHDEIHVHLAGATDAGTASVIHRTDTPLAVGTYTIKGRFRRISGTPKVPSVSRVDLLVMSMGQSGPVTLITDDMTDYLYADQ